MDIENYKVPEGYVLVLCTCKNDMTSRNGFKWPESGEVTCSDWLPNKVCGNGLHGLLKGEGDANLMDWTIDSKWLVAEVLKSSIIGLDGKVKFPSANVVYAGDQKTASNIIKRIYPECNVHGSTATAGSEGTATAGDEGVLIITYYDGNNYKRKIALIGENGIKPNIKYRLNGDFEFKEVI